MENPQLVFLMETKLKPEEVLRIKKKLNFRFDLIIDCKGSGRDRAGGLCLSWNETMDIQILSHSQNHIGGIFQLKDEKHP